MASSKRVNAVQSTFSELSVLFEHYGMDMPEYSFPSFLETLLFDRVNTRPVSLTERTPNPESDGGCPLVRSPSSVRH